ncbi:hypothetical protein ACQEVG_32915 [Streptomyces sp. CA-135486]|uniref:hypothetical protein n=1 Tax=Streptomyces sp. CA-135486 TaxID=3240049 RepID=UPI003D8C24B8
MTVPEQRTARAEEATTTLTDIVARLANNPTTEQIRAALRHHEMHVRAKVGRESGDRLTFSGRSWVVEDEPRAVDYEESSVLFEVWVKRPEDGP